MNENEEVLFDISLLTLIIYFSYINIIIYID